MREGEYYAYKEATVRQKRKRRMREVKLSECRRRKTNLEGR